MMSVTTIVSSASREHTDKAAGTGAGGAGVMTPAGDTGAGGKGTSDPGTGNRAGGAGASGATSSARRDNTDERARGERGLFCHVSTACGYALNSGAPPFFMFGHMDDGWAATQHRWCGNLIPPAVQLPTAVL